MKKPVELSADNIARINMVYPVGLLKRIDAFWHKHQFKNRTAAVLWLLDWAISQNPKPEKPVP